MGVEVEVADVLKIESRKESGLADGVIRNEMEGMMMKLEKDATTSNTEMQGQVVTQSP